MLSAAKKSEEAKARIEAKRQERMAEMKEEEEVEQPKARSGGKIPSKTPRAGKQDAAAAVAGIDLDALISVRTKQEKKKPRGKLFV